MNFTTKQINIEKIVQENLEFLIPVYQRPYVWDDTEIKKLLEDLKHNFITNTNEYFVGNTYVIKSTNDNQQNQYEVIDGQQRFTTFWLISLCFKVLNIETELTKYLEIDLNNNQKDIRFDFDIRKEVYEYLKGQLDGSSQRRFEDVSKYEFLKNIATGIETIKGILNTIPKKSSETNGNEIDLVKFGDYIYKNVMFVFNEAPLNTDLNALFVALGTSGIQLQQSDILKARLLDKIEEKNQRITYSKMWEACENMFNFFEANVKLSIPYDTSKVLENDFKEFNPKIFNCNTSNGNQNNLRGMTISEIINFEENLVSEEKSVKDSNSICRSIITFNLFLLHVLRIYRKENHFENDIDSMDGKKLLETFKIDEIENVTSFIELMWKVRYLFDKHVVKWLKDENESVDEDEKLLLSTINTTESKDKAYFSRTESKFSNSQMLQSVLYFNNIPNQIWLTPFLYFLLKNSSEAKLSEDAILNELERIDNILIPGDKKEMSWQIINETHLNPDFENGIKNILNHQSGTGFNHYWFYKLEYLLWKNWDKNDEQLKRYRITSKNSIEHIFPQNQEYRIKLYDLNDDKDWLNSFGNLALLSVGENSSYSNQDVEKKKVDFKYKTTYDSLKSAKIYSYSNWNTEEIKEHQEKMILTLKEHYLA